MGSGFAVGVPRLAAMVLYGMWISFLAQAEQALVITTIVGVFPVHPCGTPD